MQQSQFGGLDSDVAVLRSLPAMERLPITKGPSVELLQSDQVPFPSTLTMLCLRILCTTGVNTSITTMDRGRSRQCCNEQRGILWAAESTKMGLLSLRTPCMDYPKISKTQGLH